MARMQTRELGRTGIRVTPLCFGTSPLANLPGLYGYDVEEGRAVATVRAALESPVRFLDTSNGYGLHGEAELRVGAALRELGGLPGDYLLATKVDPRHRSEDFSGERVRESYRESLERLGVDRVRLLHLHDPERIGYEASVAPGGPVEALRALKESGQVDLIGVAGGALRVLRALVDTGVFDVVLTHNRYTLLDGSAKLLHRDRPRARAGRAQRGALRRRRVRERPAGDQEIRLPRARRRPCRRAGHAGRRAPGVVFPSPRRRSSFSMAARPSRPRSSASRRRSASSRPSTSRRIPSPTSCGSSSTTLTPPRSSWIDD